MPIQYEIITPRIHSITLNRPEVLNAFNFEMMDALTAVLERVRIDPQVRALILTGAGERGFSTGGDLKFLSNFETESDGRKISETMQHALDLLENLPVPTIAAVNGHARGGGAEVALACDFRVMSEKATIGFTHISVAVSTAWGGARRLLRTVGYAAAIDLLLTARVLQAQDAHRQGLVHATAAPDQLGAHCLEMAEMLAAQPPQACRAIKEILLAGIMPVSDTASLLERERFPQLWAHPDHMEKTRAFLDRRK